jgi:hypothetical protein
MYQRNSPPSTHLTRSEEIYARALMLNKLNSMHKQSIALVDLCRDKTLLLLRLVAGHTTTHSHIGT